MLKIKFSPILPNSEFLAFCSKHKGFIFSSVSEGTYAVMTQTKSLGASDIAWFPTVSSSPIYYISNHPSISKISDWKEKKQKIHSLLLKEFPQDTDLLSIHRY